MKNANNQLDTLTSPAVTKQQARERYVDSRIKRSVSINRSIRIDRVKSLNDLHRRKREAKLNTTLILTLGFVLLAFVALVIYVYNHF